MASWTDSLSGLFQGSPVTAPTYTTSTSETPKWLQDYTVDLFSQARAVAGLPYQPFGGDRLAQFTAPTQQAFDVTQNAVGQWQPGMSTAMGGTQNLANTSSVANIQNYMNPYNQAVTDQIAQMGARNLNEVLMPGISDQFINAGQFGSSRMGEFGNRALRDTQESILNQQTQALQSGYGQALGASQADLSRQQGALQQLAGLTQQQQGLSTADAAALQAIGQQQQQQTQAGLDIGYQNFQNQQAWPQKNVAFMSDILRGLPAGAYAQTSTQGGTTPVGMSPSPLSSIAALYNMYKGYNSTP